MIPKGAKCWACFFWDRKREICTRDGSGHSGKHRENMEPACEGFRRRTAEEYARTNTAGEYGAIRATPEGVTVESGTLVPITTETAVALQKDTETLGRYLTQMGQMMAALQRRLDEMEARQAAVTVSHADVKRIQAMIRNRADELCRKYELADLESAKAIRAAIKKDLLKRFLVKDLHDLPEAAMSRADALVDSWTNIRLIMERRGSA